MRMTGSESMAIEKVYENNQKKCLLCGGSGTWGAAARHTEADAVVPYRNTTSLHFLSPLSLEKLSIFENTEAK